MVVQIPEPRPSNSKTSALYKGLQVKCPASDGLNYIIYTLLPDVVSKL